jgi:hypothetical protein
MPKIKDINEIKCYFKDNGYTLLDDNYVNSKTYLNYICDKGHVGKIKWNDFHQGCRCRKCSYQKRAERRKLGIDKVRDRFNERGYTLLGERHNNSRRNFKFRCARGHISHITLDNLGEGKGCYECGLLEARERYRKPYKVVVKYFNDNDYEILSSEESYINSHSYVNFKCSKGHEGKIQIYHFYQGVRCRFCSSGPVSKMSQDWLDSLNILVENREVKLKDLGFRVDGFDPETKTVYEFLGDYWHGNPAKYPADGINAHNKKSFGRLYEETKTRILRLEEKGYKVVFVWESDFNKV